MKKAVIILVFGLATIKVVAQEEIKTTGPPLNDFYVNVLGRDALWSVNYERLIPAGKTYLAANLGVGAGYYLDFCWLGCTHNDSKSYMVVPMTITENIGGNRDYFEFGVGVTRIRESPGEHFISYGMLGYRFQPSIEGKAVFRVFVNYPFSESTLLFVPAGLSLGITFL